VVEGSTSRVEDEIIVVEIAGMKNRKYSRFHGLVLVVGFSGCFDWLLISREEEGGFSGGCWLSRGGGDLGSYG